jgi:alpha-tubulin suppressor-like RCC1 family protein
MKKLADKRHPLVVLSMLEHSMRSIFQKCLGMISCFFMLSGFCTGNFLHGKAAEHSMIIKTDGSLWGFGRNAEGQLGDGTTTNRNTPTLIISSGVVQVARGHRHTLVVKTDGSLWTFGHNNYGQLGDGSTTNRTTPTQILPSGVSQVSVGYFHSLILKTNGSLWTMGKNLYGQLGDGTNTDRNTPTQILSSGVSKIAAGGYFSLILKTDQSLWSFGMNTRGQLGDGTTTNRNTPTQTSISSLSKFFTGGEHSLILKTDGSLWSFGKNDEGQLGDGTTSSRTTPTQILSDGVSNIDADLFHSFIVKLDGSLWSFGRNSEGQLGDGTTSNRSNPTQILSSGVAQVVGGYYHSLILKTDGSLWAFGKNIDGRLGDGTTANRNTPTQILSSGVASLSDIMSLPGSANVAPVITQGAGPLTKSVAEDGTASWTPSELNATDADTAAGSLTWSVSSAAGNGVATVSGNGASPTNFSYQPYANFNGSDSFEVQVSDGNLSDTITVNVTVAAVNDAPVITQGTGPLTRTVAEDGTASWTPSELNATDIDTSAGLLTWSVSSAASNGVATVSGNGASPTTFSYQPNANFNGSDSFEVRVSDGSLSDTITVNVTVAAVNDAPVITQGAGPLTKSVAEDGTASWTPSELNATDTDTAAGSLTWSVSSAASNGVATVSGSGASPTSFSYQPNANFNGSDSFEVRVSDGNLNVTITVNVTVAAVNDAPVITQGAGPLSKTMVEDGNVSWNSTELNATDQDSSSGSLVWSVSSAASNGVATVSGSGASPTSFSYKPNANYNGSDSFEVRVSDGSLSDTITVNVTVAAVNDAPLITQGAGPLSKTMVEDGNVSWNPMELNATDQDSSSGSLVWSVSSAASNGVATVSGSGASPTSFSYKPNANFNGSDSFDVLVSDGNLSDTITVNVTVTQVDDPPFTNKKLPDINASENDSDLSIDLSGLFGDIDNEPSAIILTAESNNSSIVSTKVVQNFLILDFQYNQKGTSTISVSGKSSNQKAIVSFVVHVAPSRNNPLNTASVSTLPYADANESGIYRLQGSILNRGLFAITEGGFLLGKSHDLKFGIRYKADLIGTIDEFFIDLNDSQLDKGVTYYYRAYLNIGGHEVLGGLREFTSPKPVDPNAWYGSMESMGNGWWRSDWFGVFSVHVNEWIYHADLGWAYAVGDEQEGLWLWTSERGWLWTSEQSWPYLWHHEAANWFYFLKQEDKAGVFFDFSSGQYTE